MHQSKIQYQCQMQQHQLFSNKLPHLFVLQQALKWIKLQLINTVFLLF